MWSHITSVGDKTDSGHQVGGWALPADECCPEEATLPVRSDRRATVRTPARRPSRARALRAPSVQSCPHFMEPLIKCQAPIFDFE